MEKSDAASKGAVEYKTITMEGRLYRLSVISTVDNRLLPRKNSKSQQCIDDIDVDNLIDVEIEQFGESMYKHSFHVPSAFRGFIIGRRGDNHKKLEDDTKTAIKLPTHGNVVITGGNLESIVSARHKIDELMKNSRNKLRPTHFISIPMIDETIALNFEKFKEMVLNDTAKDCKDVNEKLFQKPEKMHLTLGVLTLIDENEVKAGIEAFQECKDIVIKPIMEKHGPIKIKAQGLGSFGENHAKLRVLYGTVSTENDALQELADKMAKFFHEKGMLKKEGDKINLHMTLMNSTFAVDRTMSYYKSVQKFDATNIMKTHKDHLFGEILLNTIHICSLSAPYTADGYYEITSKISV